MFTKRCALLVAFVSLIGQGVFTSSLLAQERLPMDNGFETYHPSPRYRESESHPLRVIAYVLHPIGWVAREFLFRPLSYFASSSVESRSIMGYREPYDYRQPSCFASSSEIPDCRQIAPFDYDSNVGRRVDSPTDAASQRQALYFPDANFDFNVRKLNAAGKAKVKLAADILKREGAVKVVLEGNTDERGTEKYNMKLGLDRAEAVKAELLSLGISADRLSTVSFGESRPLFSEKEDWAYAANRRVSVRIDDGITAEKK